MQGATEEIDRAIEDDHRFGRGNPTRVWALHPPAPPEIAPNRYPWRYPEPILGIVDNRRIRCVSRARSSAPGSVMFRPTNAGGPAMATDHVANLEKAREQLMAQRRSLAEAMARAYQRGETEGQMELFRSIQGTLADIEEAITDERRRAPQRGAKEFSERPYGEKPEARPLCAYHGLPG